MQIAAQDYDPIVALDPKGPEKLAAESIAYICRTMPELGEKVFSVEDAALVLEAFQMYESCGKIIRHPGKLQLQENREDALHPPVEYERLLLSGLRHVTWQNKVHLYDRLEL